MKKLGFRLLIVITALSYNLISCAESPQKTQKERFESRDLGGPESILKGRYQPVIGTGGMVVSDDRQASEWGAEILRRGGNAVDAAVGTAFALAVTRPHYASLGGGGFMIYCPHPTQNRPEPCEALDYREVAPKLAARDMYLHNGKANTSLAQNGALAAGVPGVPAGLLFALEKFGTVSRNEILSRPITIARKGYRFTANSEAAAVNRWTSMNDSAKRIFGCDKNVSDNSNTATPNSPCRPGSLIKQPDLQKVLEAIARSGAAGFYKGIIAKKITEGIQAAGGIITLEDLQSYQPILRKPLQGRFREYEVVSMPPPSSGGLIILQLLGYANLASKEGYLSKGFGSATTIHAITHAMGLAFADRTQYLGDPEFTDVPVTALLAPGYLNHQWTTFKPGTAHLPKQPGQLSNLNEPQNTTHFSVIDRFGNAVAITTTVNDNFGSGFVPPGTGIVMNNEMDDFSIQSGVPNLFGLIGSDANSIRPGKHPLSSMSPTVVRDLQGNNRIIIGAAGGPRIITSVFLSLLNRLEFGMSLIDAVAAPRFHEQWKPEALLLERNGFSAEVRSELEKIGYAPIEVGSLAKVHAIERMPNDGRVSGAADLRGEGAAVPE